jgi:uncharacterized membrane-anchored protein YjiN (DUF445 family)
MNEQKQLADLRRMKRLASALFWFFTALFLISSIFVERAIWIGFVQATAEAAMVGAVADWFAVTALFRHPLGLKIPHTAIIPQRKDSIGQTLGQFVKDNFLAGEVVADKLRSMNASRNIAAWISRPANSLLLANYVAVGLAAALQVMKDEDIQELIQQNLTQQIRSAQLAPLLGNVLALITSGERKQKLVQGGVKLAAHLIEENKSTLKKKIAEETPWWLPKNVDNAIYQKIIDASERTLSEVRSDPTHPFHNQIDRLITEFIDDLKHSPDMVARESALKEDLLADPMVQDFSSSLWVDLKASLIAYSSNPDTDTRKPIQQGIIRFGEAILRDEMMLVKIDGWLEEAAVYIVEEYGYEMEQLIAQTIKKWDAEETSRKMELHVGKDLQFIRINGTLVGGLVGFIIHAVSLFL